MREPPIASNSSINTMQGELSLAESLHTLNQGGDYDYFLFSLNRFRTRAAPTPTNISSNSDPEQKKNGTPASPATARASIVFPVPGGPMRRTPAIGKNQGKRRLCLY